MLISASGKVMQRQSWWGREDEAIISAINSMDPVSSW